MDNLNISLNLLQHIFSQESRNIVGKSMKRYEIAIQNKKDSGLPVTFSEEELNLLKAEQKELLHETLRDIRHILVYTANSKNNIHLERKK